jgi:hypothetical protein
LISNYNGTPCQTFGQGFKDHLATVAGNPPPPPVPTSTRPPATSVPSRTPTSPPATAVRTRTPTPPAATATPVPPSPTPVHTATTTPAGNGTSVDDSVRGRGTNQVNYVGANWQHCTGCGGELYNRSNSWNGTANQSLTVSFSGTQLNFYGVVDAHHGIGTVSIDGGPETSIDFYRATRAGNVRLWSSPVLADGPHTFRLRVTGTKNASSTGTMVAIDRVEIVP